MKRELVPKGFYCKPLAAKAAEFSPGGEVSFSLIVLCILNASSFRSVERLTRLFNTHFFTKNSTLIYIADLSH